MHSPSSPMPAAGASHPGRRDDRRPFPAELSFLLIALSLLVILMLAGVPGKTRRAGDGSESLRHGWAAAHAAQVAEEQALAPAEPGVPDAGLDRAEAQR